MNEFPVVRYFLICEQVVPSADRKSVSLQNLIHAIARLPGEPFPCVCEPIAVYALLTNGRGSHEFHVELTAFERGTEQLIAKSGVLQRDLGQDPTMVFGLPLPIRRIVFPVAGQYTFHLMCDGQSIATQHVLVR